MDDLDGRPAVDDQARARRERDARRRLLDLGADALAARPWQPPPAPPSAVDLVRFFLWWSGGPGRTAPDDDVAEAAVAALHLLPAARAELDGLEAALLFTARGTGLTWDRTARAMGLTSRQAGRQRLDRLTARLDRAGEVGAP